MTLGEFRRKTADLPDNLDLYIGERLTDFKYGYVNTVEKKMITFSEEPDSKPLSKVEVIILSED